MLALGDVMAGIRNEKNEREKKASQRRQEKKLAREPEASRDDLSIDYL